MVRVPTYDGQQVRERAAFQQGVSVQASPGAFGADIGAGMQQLGRGMGQVADTMGQMQALTDETHARDGLTQYVRQKDDLAYGEGGFMTLEGRAAVDGAQDFGRKLEQSRREISAKLSPGAQKLFDKASTSVETDTRRSAMQHRGAQLKAYVIETGQSQAETFKQQAVSALGDPEQAEKYRTAMAGTIADLGAKQGWDAATTRAKIAEQDSDLTRLTALSMSQADPVAASAWLEKNAARMSPVDLLNTRAALMKPLADAAGRDAVAGARQAATTFAASDLPAEAYGLLGVIAGTESPGYDVLNGGERFQDFSDHPRRKGAGGTTTAAGRYQFVKDTWDRTAAANGFTSFAPENQDRGAWWLAGQDYKARTGRDLMADLRAGDYAAVRKGLAGTWEGLAKLSDEQFANRMQRAGGIAFSPRVQAAVDALPADLAGQVREAARNDFAAFQTQQAAEVKAQRLAVADDFRLRIAEGDTSLTRGEILSDRLLDAGDKAALLTSLNEKTKAIQQVQADVAAFQAGQMMVDPYDTDGRKRVDALWTEQTRSQAPGTDNRALIDGIVQQTGIIPASVSGALRQALTGTNAQQVEHALVVGSRLNAIDPAAFGRRDGGAQIAEAVGMFDNLTGTVGLSPRDAAKRIADLNDPQKRADRTALLKSPETVKWLKDTGTESDARAIFDPGMFSATPKLGETPAQAAAATAEFADILTESFADTNGDRDLAKTLAADRMRKRYGVSAYNLSQTNAITRLPPEVTLPAGIDGTHGYIGTQAKEALSGEGISAKDVFLQADTRTEADVRAGRPPRYVMFYTDEDGMLQQFQHPWSAEPPSRAEVAEARKAEAMKRRDAARDQHERANELKANSPAYQGWAASGF